MIRINDWNDRNPEAGEEDFSSVEGIVERIIFCNEANGYTVCELSVDSDEAITAVGIMPFLALGESVRAVGEWVVHPTFGRQFKVLYCEKQLPATASSILKYLSSKTIKGIGPKTAKALVERYGDETLDVIENHPEWLQELPGISKRKAEEISASFREQYGIRSVMLFCRNYFGPTISMSIYKKWGNDSVETMKENPYLLCEEIEGVSFQKADEIAHAIGLKRDNPHRIMAAICYLCSYNAFQNGHVFLPREKVLAGAEQMLCVGTEQVESAYRQLIVDQKLICADRDGIRAVYLTEYYRAEKEICEKLDLLDRIHQPETGDSTERWIEKIQIEEGITYNRLQKKAIAFSLNAGVMILTGGPGTGKTTVIRAIIRIYSEMGYKIALAAPTGRAAKRMSEATSSEAKTIHRMLEMEYGEEERPHFKRNRDRTLPEDVIIIDEASMIDLLLMDALLQAVKPGARLILIGDADQLPPVGAGYVFRDMIRSDRYSTVHLKEVFRQSRESLIITNAHAINHGEHPNLKETKRDFFFLPCTGDKQIAETVIHLCSDRLPKAYGEAVRDQIQVITPSRKGEAGTEMLNRLLQRELNPPAPGKREKPFRDILFREGDHVMQIKNNYDITWERVIHGLRQEGVGIYNGDIGIIRSIDPLSETVEVDFDERIAVYDYSMLEELDHSYAITVHKSQGSEYPIVILPVFPYSRRLLTRNLLYTAVTRASKMIILVGEEETVYQMIDNNRQAKRYSGIPYLMSRFDSEQPEEPELSEPLDPALDLPE
ncbi:MAG: ATP-dependent RecD-like DNA helicase [Clostridia bacterium]|nr:ATP-dependent RecD-like DNA helicase [Clostridia bacterium]